MEVWVAILVAVISGIFSLIGVVITNNHSNNKIQNEMKTSQAVTNEQIKELTREVRMHNDFAIRIPVLEEKFERVNSRLGKLEAYHQHHTGRSDMDN